MKREKDKESIYYFLLNNEAEEREKILIKNGALLENNNIDFEYSLEKIKKITHQNVVVYLKIEINKNLKYLFFVDDNFNDYVFIKDDLEHNEDTVIKITFDEKTNQNVYSLVKINYTIENGKIRIKK